MKIARGGYQDRRYDGHLISECPNVYFADCAVPKDRNEIFNLNEDVFFVWENSIPMANSMPIAIHILAWMGARTVHLVGCDLGGEKDYYDDRVLTDDQRKYNRRSYGNTNEYLKWFSGESKKHGIELISCTPKSPINEYLTYCPLKDALVTSRAKVPSGQTGMKHILEV